MSFFSCPICGLSLISDNRSLRCISGHCFDISKYGYVNLLLSQKSSDKRHGDDKLMLSARSRFLERGYYLPLLNTISESAYKYINGNAEILDIGCGEGWYMAGLKNFLESNGIVSEFSGIDISKEALRLAAKRCKGAKFAVASSSSLPFSDKTFDLILNVFAPMTESEAVRVLKPGGIIMKAVPLPRHLWSLKAAVYQVPRENKPLNNKDIDGLSILEQIPICYKFHLASSDEIADLFKMTPYYYKTGKEDKKKLETLSDLSVEAEFLLLIYRK